MGDYSFLTTLTRVPETSVTGITDLDIALTSNGFVMLYGTSRSASLTSGYALAGDGSATFSGETVLSSEISQIEIITIDGVRHALAIGPGLDDQLLWEIDAAGGLINPQIIPTSAAAFGGFSDIASLTIGGSTFLYGVGRTDASVYGYQVDTSGSQAGQTSQAPPPILTGVSRLDTAYVEGTSLLLAVSDDGNTLTSHTVAANGVLTQADSTGAADGLGVAGITEVAHVTLPDGDYLIVAARDSSSLSVLRIEPDGDLTPVDHIIDDLNARFQNVTALAVETIDDRVVVAAGGADDGVSLFELLPGGRLHHTETLIDDSDRALDSIGAIELVRTGDMLNLFVGSLIEAGISHFRRAINNWTTTWIGTGGDDQVTGDSRDQVFWGRAGDDTISAGAGDDILMDGSGQDVLTGGAGADRFVLADDAHDDTVADFNAAEDVIDLSGWTFLRNAQQINFTATATGGILTYRDETLEVISHDSQPLTEAGILIDGTFNVTRFPVGNPSEGNEITGTSSAEELSGGTEDNVIEGLYGNDTLFGGAGDDILIGGAGADLIDGGIGEDTVSFSDATGGVQADLAFPGGNTGFAAGDSYVDVEHLEGSAFGDNLRGTDAANRVKAGAGNDTVFGRNGNDTLVGDAGDDILLGGLGADTIDGGAGTDRAAYWAATGAILADMLDPTNNTGEAGGDIYTAIEDLQGGDFDDDLRGNAGVNRLWGGNGRDTIYGRDGNDQLFGGNGDDLLLGGAGADLMDGGAGRDRAAYWTAQSAILADLIYPDIGTGDAAGDVFSSVEDLQGTNFNDNLRGDNADNSIWGVGGNDVIYGRGGNDLLFGQNGDDVILGGAGSDLIDGGAGIDRAAYWLAPTAVRVDLLAPGNNTGEAAGDSFSDVEDIQGSNFADDLRGDNGANRLWGGLGGDTLYGRGGSDQLYGQDGNDILLPGGGADLIDGGAGIDRVAYWTAGAGITASLANPGINTGDAAGDSYTGVEALQGSNFNDWLEGDALANTLYGGGGADTLSGGNGDDTLNGGGGADEFVFTSGDDVVEDFSPGTDTLAFDNAVTGGLTPSAILALATADGAGTRFSFTGHSLFIEDVAPGAFSVSDIVVL